MRKSKNEKTKDVLLTFFRFFILHYFILSPFYSVTFSFFHPFILSFYYQLTI